MAQPFSPTWNNACAIGKDLNINQFQTNLFDPKPVCIDQYNRIKTLNDMVDWLKTKNIPHKSGVTVAAAEELPGDLLGPVLQLKEGQVIKVTTTVGVAICN